MLIVAIPLVMAVVASALLLTEKKFKLQEVKTR
jgi:hypothetical protein